MKTVFVSDLKEMTEKEMIIDIREEDAFQYGAIPGAIHLPFINLKDNYHKIPNDKKVIIYCQKGQQSIEVVEWLVQHEIGRAHV